MDSFFFEDDNEITKEGKFFSNVVGYEDIKKLLLRSIVAKEPVQRTFNRSTIILQDSFFIGNVRGFG